MSADEIARQVALMTDQEIKVIEAALRHRRELNSAILREEAEEEPAKASGRKMSSTEAMDYVFDNFDGLLRRLAQ